MASACLVGIDPGERWIGVARAPAESSLALPVGTIDRKMTGATPEAIADALQALLGTDAVRALIVGVPVRPTGGEDEQASAFRALGEGVAAAMGVACFAQNERFTSAGTVAVAQFGAKRRGNKARRPGGKSAARQRRDRERAHADSAARILQRWIDDREAAETARSTDAEW